MWVWAWHWGPEQTAAGITLTLTGAAEPRLQMNFPIIATVWQYSTKICFKMEKPSTMATMMISQPQSKITFA